MKKVLRKLLVFTIVLALCMAGTIAAAADSGATAAPASAVTGIKVQYNGKYIVFSDAKPQVINQRTMVPFRQIFETMGADVTYDESTKTVHAVKNGLEISFVIGQTDITIKKDGKTTIKKMDVVPYVDYNLNRVFVPVRFMAESMNYSVSWDQNAQTAVIIDPASIFGNADKDFSVISKLMTAELDPEKSYETTGSFQSDIVFPGMNQMPGELSFSISGDVRGIQKKTSADMVMNLVLNADKMLEAMTPEEQATIKPILDMFKNINMDVKMDGENGDLFINSNLFRAMDPTIDEKTWFKMNIFETYDQMGIDIRPLMESSMSVTSISELLQDSIRNISNFNVNSYENMRNAYAFAKNLVGDEKFSSVASGSIITYTLKIDEDDILAAMSKTAIAEGVQFDSVNMDEISEAINSLKINADITIRVENNKLHSYDLAGSFSFEDVTATFDIAGDTMRSTVDMQFKKPGFMDISIKADSIYAETAKTPDLTLPADARVLDYFQYFMQQVPQGVPQN